MLSKDNRSDSSRDKETSPGTPDRGLLDAKSALRLLLRDPRVLLTDPGGKRASPVSLPGELGNATAGVAFRRREKVDLLQLSADTTAVTPATADIALKACV
jgi:hypothetical protein